MIFDPGLASLDGVAHAFFTRAGGVSTGIYAGLNAGPGSADKPSRVSRNRAIAAKHLGATPDRLLSLHQFHSANVVRVEQAWPSDARPKADAMVTDRPGLALGVLSADCGPVLFADPVAYVIGAAHAGWRGALDGVLEDVGSHGR